MLTESWWLILGIAVASVGVILTDAPHRAMWAERLDRRADVREQRRAEAAADESARKHWASIDRLRDAGLHADADDMASRALRRGIERPR